MVYVIQEQSNKNILSAKEFGEIKFLLPHGMQVLFSSGQCTQKLLFALSNFCNDDYLLLIGDPAAIGIAVAVASHWNNGKVKMLKWDRQERQYYPISMNIHSNLQKGESHVEEIIEE
jgi:hypothetical protein